jgi:hypothetical protein
MFRWDTVGATSIRLAAPSAAAAASHAAASPEPALQALMDACAIPVIVHDYHRAAILGNATLITHRGRPWLLTAAHLLDYAPRCGNWLVPAREDGALLPLEGARVRRAAHLDVALIELRHLDALPRILHGRRPLPIDAAAVPHRPGHEAVYAVSGFPAAWSQFERGWLAARRLTVLTCRSRQARQRARHDRVYDYGHVALAGSGQWIHTPALEGMSGAGIWALSTDREGRQHARLAAVQSAFLHSRYLRGHDARAALPLLLEERGGQR